MAETRADERVPSLDDPPRLGIAALARDTAIYGATRVLLKSLAFLLVPLYARYLSPAEFGAYELILATVAFVDVLVAANMDGAFARYYFERDDAAWRRQIVSLYLAIETVYPALVVGALITVSGVLSDRVFGAGTYAAFFVIALVDLYLTNVVDLPMMLARLRRKPLTFAFYSLSRGLVQVVFTVLLVAVWHLEVKGILIASLISVCVAFVVTLREYVRDLTTKVSWAVAREMIAFAWPGIVGGVAFYALNLLDRFFIKHYHGLADNGLYGVAFRFSQIVLVGVLAFRMGWTQWHYAQLHGGRHPEVVARGAAYYFFGAGFLAVTVAAWILPVFHLLMPERYWDATVAVAPLALAAVATGAYTLFAVGLNVAKRMRLLPPLSIAGALVAIGLYFLLIPPYSFVGAAWATAGGFTALAALVLVVSQRIYPVPWEWGRIGAAAVLAIALAVAALAVDKWLPLTASLPVRVVLTLAYPALLFAGGLFPPGDVATLRARLARR